MDTKDLLLRLYFTSDWHDLGLNDTQFKKVQDLVRFIWGVNPLGRKIRLFRLTSKGKLEAERLLSKYGRMLFSPRGIAFEVRRWIRVEEMKFSADEIREAFFEFGSLTEALIHVGGYGYSGYMRISIVDFESAMAMVPDILESETRVSPALSWLLEYMKSPEIQGAIKDHDDRCQEFVIWDASTLPTKSRSS
jgi:hypothetical protein